MLLTLLRTLDISTQMVFQFLTTTTGNSSSAVPTKIHGDGEIAFLGIQATEFDEICCIAKKLAFCYLKKKRFYSVHNFFTKNRCNLQNEKKTQV